MRDSIARLQGLAHSDALRAREAQNVLTQLASEMEVDRAALKTQTEQDVLRATATVASRQRIFTWTWDSSELRYGNRVESAPPPLSLDDRLAQLASAPSVDLTVFKDVLAEVTRAKTTRYGAASYGVAEGFANATDAARGLVWVSTALQQLVAPAPAQDPFAVVFIEYFVGQSDVYALSWHAVTDNADAITGVSAAQVWRVMPAAQLRSYATPADFRQVYASDAELGERLLGRALGDPLEGSANPSGGSFGLMVAPDGPLWLTRWEQIRFNPRRVEKVAARGAGDVRQASTLRELLAPRDLGRGKQAWRRAGIWCVPTLAGQWREPSGETSELKLGVLVPGQKPSVASFRGKGALTFAPVNDPTLAGDFAWAQFARSVRADEIGYLFWDRHWDARGWTPTPFTSFALLQMP